MSTPIHSNLAPSAASRWTVCTASVAYIEAHKGEFPPEGSAFADEGTAAHAVAAAKLLRTVGQTAPDEEMESCTRDYVEWVAANTKTGNLMVEKKVPLFYLPGNNGTVDAAARTPERIFIGDLKYGRGVSVEAEGNKQLAIYAESIIRDQLEIIDEVPGDFPVTLGIFQPRDRNNSEAIREWHLTRAELALFCCPIQAAADLILKTPQLCQFVADPEKQCRFCPAKGICPAYNHHSLSCFTAVPEELSKPEHFELPPVTTIPREKRQVILSMAPGIRKWLDAVEEQEMHELMQGAVALCYKLVAGKTNRQWVDEAATDKLLRNYLKADEIRPPSSVVSPAQVEKLLKAHTTSTRFDNALQKLIVKPEGKPTLVPVEDKRPALELGATTTTKQFDNEDIV